MQCWLWTNCQATQLQLLRRGETPTAGGRTICQGSSCVSLASSNIHTTRRNPGLVCASVILVRLDLFILRSQMDVFLQKMQVPVWINSWTRKINRGKLLPILAANAGQRKRLLCICFYMCVWCTLYWEKNYVNHIWSEQYLTYVSLHRQCNVYQPIPSATSQPHSDIPVFSFAEFTTENESSAATNVEFPLPQHRFCAESLSNLHNSPNSSAC